MAATRIFASLLATALGLGCALDDGGDPGAGGGPGGKADDLAGGGLPDPNAAEPPAADWSPPAPADWPAAYPIFNNTGCGHDCDRADQDELRPRSVMLKMTIAAIDAAAEGGTVRVANFNISKSASVTPVADALVRAMARGVTVKIAMDVAQDVAGSRTHELAAAGAEVRFTPGLRFKGFGGATQTGILHSKMVIVDDQLLLTGSNNFSSTGFITNEENSVMVRAPENRDRIAAFTCDFEAMFAAGAAPGEAAPADDDPVRAAAIASLDDCNTADAWFPPSGTLTTGRSIAFGKLSSAIRGADHSIDLAPDMLSHPGLVAALVSRARKAKADGDDDFRIRIVLDGSPEALGNPAFGDCAAEAAAAEALAIEVRYWPGTEEIFQLLHHKFVIIDGGTADAALYNGSANWSPKALKQSFENVTRYRGEAFSGVVAAFETRFEALFDQALDKAALADEGTEAPACPVALDDLF